MIVEVYSTQERRIGGMTLRKPDRRQFAQAGSCVVCVLVMLRVTDLRETEFSGGWLTGPLLTLADIGTLLFLLALIAAFVFPRVAAATSLAASLLSLPLCLFFIAPVPFAHVFASGHEFKVEPSPGFHWETWPVAGLVLLGLTCYLCIRLIARRTEGNTPVHA